MEFVRVTLKVPQDLHDKYVKASKNLGIAKSALMVLDLKKATDSEEVLQGMKNKSE